MKLNKSKNKGKVHPSPSQSSSNDTVSTLNNLLPTAILTLISVLSLQDKVVLAYMITHSLSSTSALTNHHNDGKKTNSNSSSGGGGGKKAGGGHKVPTFECGCFECYTSYWYRWDSSPNRELIHQAIEAFEELNTTTTTHSSSSSSTGTKKVNKAPSSTASPPPPPPVVVVAAVKEESLPEEVVVSPSGEVAGEGKSRSPKKQAQQQHKGLARKVLPDVIGLFNSRLWNLWGPNV